MFFFLCVTQPWPSTAHLGSRNKNWMSILVAMSSDKSTNWRDTPPALAAMSHLSTAISAIVTALWTGSIDPPRFISPTMIKPPCTLRFKSDVHVGNQRCHAQLSPRLCCIKCSWTVNARAVLDLCRRPTAWIWRTGSASAKPMLWNAGGWAC